MKTSLGPKPMAYPAPVYVVGTYDAEGRPNVMTVAWGGICCSKPPCVSISVRKATYTYSNLMERKAFTISLPSRDDVVAADYFGIASGRDVDKFAAAGLTPVRSDLVDAPYVGEFPMALECKIVHVAELGLHTLFVGEILDVKVDDACLNTDGKVVAELVRPFTWASPDNTYYALGDGLGKGFAVGKALVSKES
ncbi:MAG: flavin reductase family protein [Thermoleophilia bacterium]|nr:flavin reductase family protein [Thermoleophilia bacterium]